MASVEDTVPAGKRGGGRSKHGAACDHVSCQSHAIRAQWGLPAEVAFGCMTAMFLVRAGAVGRLDRFSTHGNKFSTRSSNTSGFAWWACFSAFCGVRVRETCTARGSPAVSLVCAFDPSKDPT